MLRLFLLTVGLCAAVLGTRKSKHGNFYNPKPNKHFRHFISAILSNNLQPDQTVAVGGRPANVAEFPYQSSLRLSQTPNTHFCSGAIITNRWILTSAVCTNNRPHTGIIANVGTVFTNSGGVAHPSIQVITHPNANLNAFLNE